MNFGGNRWRDKVGGSGGTQWIGFSVQPSDRIQASVSANYSAGTDSAQWIVNEDADADDFTDYIYSTLKRDVVDLTFRATYAFTRDLTLQAYVQPFVAVGDYYDIRKLALPYSYLFSPVSMSYDPDFNTKSLRGNAVLPVGVRPRQHAVCRVGSFAGRLHAARRLQTVERHQQRVPCRRDAHADGQSDLLDQSMTAGPPRECDQCSAFTAPAGRVASDASVRTP